MSEPLDTEAGEAVLLTSPFIEGSPDFSGERSILLIVDATEGSSQSTSSKLQLECQPDVARQLKGVRHVEGRKRLDCLCQGLVVETLEELVCRQRQDIVQPPADVPELLPGSASRTGPVPYNAVGQFQPGGLGKRADPGARRSGGGVDLLESPEGRGESSD